MNSEIFVHPQSSTTSSTTELKLRAVRPKAKNATNDKPVAAIIRPITTVDSEQKIVRLEAAEQSVVPAPHRRTHELEDYVKWLRDRVAHQRAEKAKKQEAESTFEPLVNENAISIDRLVEAVNVSPTKDEASASVTEPPVEHKISIENKKSETSIPRQLGYSADKLFREDEGHASVISPVSNLKYVTAYDIGRIEEKLAQAKLLIQPNEPEHAKQAEHVEPVAQIEQVESRQEATDAELEAHVAKLQWLIDEQSYASPEPSVQPSLSSISTPNKDELIHAVSKAIAEVLSEQTEAEVEKKIRVQLDDRSDDLASSPMVAQQITSTLKQAVSDKGFETETDANTEAETDTVPSVVTQDAASIDEQPSTPQISISDEIPASVAAWDVEDFRWPQVTSHMIAYGTEAVRQLANSVFEMSSIEPHRIAITSSGRGEGSTSIAISLARWAAATRKKVLLVDADLASPGMSKQVGLAANLSWINTLQDSIPPSEAIIRSQKSPICLMPLAPIVTRVTFPRFLYDSLGEQIKQVQSSFDLVIYDVGPVSQLVTELSRPELLLDSAVVVENGTARQSASKPAILRLQEFGVSRYVVAHNAVDQVATNVA